ASRSFAYMGVAVFEAVAGGSDDLTTLAGQLHGLTPVPPREAGKTYDNRVIVQAVMAFSAQNLFSHTGPTGQRAMAKLEEKLRPAVAAGLPADVVARSDAYGQAVAKHVLDWSEGDGGADVQNMGFPLDYKLIPGPAHWVPTSTFGQQQ